MRKLYAIIFFFNSLILFPLRVNGQNNPSTNLKTARLEAFESAMKSRLENSNEQEKIAVPDTNNNLSPNPPPILPPDYFSDYDNLPGPPPTEIIAGNSSMTGQILSFDGTAIEFANVVVYQKNSKTIVKAAITQEKGLFAIRELSDGDYYAIISFIGFPDLQIEHIFLNENQELNLGELRFAPPGVELSTAEIVANRPLVEVKPDRISFNVSGTINSTGANANSLLRKAPSVTIDNNNDIRINGQSGVVIYIDGRPAPFTGEQLTNYLQSLNANQIDKIDIISNPGVQYEAQGSAGIIDIILNQNVDHGTNGSAGYTWSQGKHFRNNINGMLNRRTKRFNFYGNGGVGKATNLNTSESLSTQNDIVLKATSNDKDLKRFRNWRIGTDYFLNKRHRFGIFLDRFRMLGDIESLNQTTISNLNNVGLVDSVLLVNNQDSILAKHRQFNLNYQFLDRIHDRLWKIDINSGTFKNIKFRNQPNQYFSSTSGILLSENTNQQDLPSDIFLKSFKIDHERNVGNGRLRLGGKISNIISENLLEIQSDSIQSPDIFGTSTQQFDYNEQTYAVYGSYARKVKKWSYDFGLRSELTNAKGQSNLLSSNNEDTTITFNYFNLFPNLNLRYSVGPNLEIYSNYSRRIRRPDFSTLNPFESQVNDLSLELGNPILNPEIVNKAEFGMTIKYLYHIKLAYTVANDQITPFNTPDNMDQRADIFSWNNIQKQKQLSIDFSAPIQITKWWNTFNTLNIGQTQFESSFETIFSNIDSKATSVMIFHQSTFQLPKDIRGEVGFWHQGGGLWNGVFEHDSVWELNIGLARSFMKDQLQVQLSVNDLFFSTGANGRSNFSGRFSESKANWDSRRFAMSLSYFFGNRKQPTKQPFQLEEEEKTGQEKDAGRVEHRNFIF